MFYVWNVRILFLFGVDFLHSEVNLIIISNYLNVGPHLKKDNDVKWANDGAIHWKKENNKNIWLQSINIFMLYESD